MEEHESEFDVIITDSSDPIGSMAYSLLSVYLNNNNYYNNYLNLTLRERGERETERQRDRETERQRDRETERQRDRETERQRDRETERQRDREMKVVLL